MLRVQYLLQQLRLIGLTVTHIYYPHISVQLSKDHLWTQFATGHKLMNCNRDIYYTFFLIEIEGIRGCLQSNKRMFRLGVWKADAPLPYVWLPNLFLWLLLHSDEHISVWERERETMKYSVRQCQSDNERSLWSIMSGHGHPSPIDFFMSIVSVPLPLSNSTLTVRTSFLQGIHFMTV